MKVGQFSDTFLPVVDGVGRVVSNYAKIMGELCDACYVVTPKQKNYNQEISTYEILEYSGIAVPKMHQYRVGIPVLDARYQSRIAKVRLDIIHAHSPFVAGREAYRISRQQGIPLVATFHSKYYDDFYQISHSKTLSKLGNKFVMDFFSKCDQVWAVSKSTAEVLRSYGYKGSIEVIENGTDLKEPDLEAIKMVEKLYNIELEPVLLFVGQMNWKKNIRRVLEAVETLVKQGRKLRLMMAGQGPSEREIHELTTSLGLDNIVTYTGHINDARVLDGLYARADLFVFPSLYDNAPMVVREAAAIGTPSLLAIGSNAAEVVQDGKNGLLASNTNFDMAERIAWALDHPNELKEIGYAAKQTIPKPWKDIVADVLERYEDLIHTSKSIGLRKSQM
ncbi:MAG: glycosyltransferase family 4 protein [Clostridiales bacterium]|nr:glycosyltransferase family 4 protein [Clostridiales bacterium]